MTPSALLSALAAAAAAAGISCTATALVPLLLCSTETATQSTFLPFLSFSSAPTYGADNVDTSQSECVCREQQSTRAGATGLGRRRRQPLQLLKQQQQLRTMLAHCVCLPIASCTVAVHCNWLLPATTVRLLVGRPDSAPLRAHWLTSGGAGVATLYKLLWGAPLLLGLLSSFWQWDIQQCW